MQHGTTSPTERAGVHRVGLNVSDSLKWIFREQPTDDYGIDGHIELVDDDQYVTGRLIGVQVKSGDSYLYEVARSKTEPGWHYRADSNHLAYWLGHCLPVIVTFVDGEQNSYWQVVTPANIKEEAKGFTIWVPETNRLDSDAKKALQTFATTWRSLDTSLPDNYRELPSGATACLKRAEPIDGFAVARLADILARGSSNARFTAEAVVSSTPSWITGSAVAEDLWLAVATYAYEHNHGLIASKAFAQAAAQNGPRRGRSLAFAGLAVVTHSREEARPFLLQAVDAGETLLSAVGLSMIDVPVDDARAVPVPAAIASADPDEIDKEPTVLNFLAELALRSQDTTRAVQLREKAVAASREPGGSMNLVLSGTLWRQLREVGDRNAAVRRRAIALVQETVEARRMWHGPSDEALELLLDIFNTAGMFKEALAAALPDAEGGTALAHEVTTAVARRGALAAQAIGDKSASAHFREVLGDSPERKELDALVQDVVPASRDERLRRWSELLKEAPDDQMRSRIVARIVRLGAWTEAADDMESRSVLPPFQADIFRAIYQANDPTRDQQLGVSKLRDLARKSSLAAYELIRHLEETAEPAQAIKAAEELTQHWGDTTLADQLVDLHWRLGDPATAVALVTQYVRDDAFADSTRADMGRRAADYLARNGNHDEAVDLARAGLAVTSDDDLAWTLIENLHALGRIPEARDELSRRQPAPSVEHERRLWVELRLGTHLETADAWALVGLIRQQPAGTLRSDMTALLVREVLQSTPEGVTYPEELVTATRDLQDSEGLLPQEAELSTDALLRERVVRPLAAAGDYPKALAAYVAGTQPLADVAEATNQTWGAAVLQRPAGVHAVSDLTPGLRAVGQQAADIALSQQQCAIDIPALYTLILLKDDDRLRIRGLLTSLTLPASFARDVSRTRAQVRAIITADRTLGINSAGHTAWITPSFKQRAELQRAAGLLEQQAAAAHTAATAPAAPYSQLAALAQKASLTVWCDDNAGRQLLRGRGVATFSTVDLLAALAPHLDVRAISQHLATQQVVDLPLSGHQVVALGLEHGWGSLEDRTPVHGVLLREGWWGNKNRQPKSGGPSPLGVPEQEWAPSWEQDWILVAEAAAACSARDLTEVTRAAVHGLRASVTTGLQPQSHLRLLVLALEACHLAGATPKRDYLDRVAAEVPAGTAPDPSVVRAAFATHLAVTGVEAPDDVAVRLLPWVPF